MKKLLVAYFLLVAVWVAYLGACALSYGHPIQVVGWASTASVTAGRKLVIGYTVTRLQLCEVTRYVSIVDGHGRLHEFPAEYRAAMGRVGDTESFFIERLVPADASPGTARYRAILAFECPLAVGPIRLPNALHQFTPNTLILPDIEFEILPGTSS